MIGMLLAGALAAAVLLVPDGARAAGDAEKGAKAWGKCKACHTLEEGGKHRIGPNLFAVYGRKCGTAVGYKYSAAFATACNAAGFVWDDATLDAFIADPSKYLSDVAGQPLRSKMILKLNAPGERRNLTAYLKSLVR